MKDILRKKISSNKNLLDSLETKRQNLERQIHDLTEKIQRQEYQLKSLEAKDLKEQLEAYSDIEEIPEPGLQTPNIDKIEE